MWPLDAPSIQWLHSLSDGDQKTPAAIGGTVVDITLRRANIFGCVLYAMGLDDSLGAERCVTAWERSSVVVESAVLHRGPRHVVSELFEDIAIRSNQASVPPQL